MSLQLQAAGESNLVRYALLVAVTATGVSLIEIGIEEICLMAHYVGEVL